MKLLSEDEIHRQIRDSLLSGWLVVSGDNDCIEWLENQVYPPGTALNQDFALIMGPAHARHPALIGFLFLAKKTPRLLGFLRSFSRGRITDEQYELGVELRFDKCPHSQVRVIITSAKDRTTAARDIAGLANRLMQMKNCA